MMRRTASTICAALPMTALKALTKLAVITKVTSILLIDLHIWIVRVKKVIDAAVKLDTSIRKGISTYVKQELQYLIEMILVACTKPRPALLRWPRSNSLQPRLGSYTEPYEQDDCL